MKVCAACGLPAPSTTLACALCSHPFPNQGPASYRLESHAGGYRWSRDGEEIVTATWRDGSWDVVDADSGKVALTLLGVSHDDRPRVAMVDHRYRKVATFVPAEADASTGCGLVYDSYDRVLIALRADGPTGIHLVDVHGRVLALASRRPGRGVGLDLLVTRAGVSGNETVVFGASLALELLRAGELHSRRETLLGD